MTWYRLTGGCNEWPQHLRTDRRNGVWDAPYIELVRASLITFVVLDHCGKPVSDPRLLVQWQKHMRDQLMRTVNGM
jgi:hypothetical protein